MSFKVISTLLTSPEKNLSATDAAIAVSSRFDAHLDIYAIGLDRTDPGFYYAGAEAIARAENLNVAKENQDSIEEWVTKRMGHEVQAWSCVGTTLHQSALQRFLTIRLRFSDLVMLPRPYQEKGSFDEAAVVEACLFGAERPVLMIPEGAAPPKPGGRIVLGWNEGAEACSAARAALPFLKKADQVDICVIDPPRHTENRSDPGGLIAQYLARHGVKSQVAVMARTEHSIASILMRKAQEIGAEMIVTGAYGHSRLREAVFGGTSREMLSSCELPLFMSR